MNEATTRHLEGNGAGLVREIALAERVKQGLSRLYRVDDLPHVGDFVTEAAHDEREALFVRDGLEDIEVELRLPRLGSSELDLEVGDLDPLCQIIEGVSHFVYLAARAMRRRETTQLELEIQAEVDKYLVLAHAAPSFSRRSSERLRTRLYGSVSYCHEADTPEGERYRVANETALRFTDKVEKRFAGSERRRAMREDLRAFFEMGLQEKLRAAR